MRIMRIIVLGVLGIVIAFVGSLMFKLGAFRDVKFSINEEPAMILIAKNHEGAYHKILPVIEEVETWAKSQNINCSKSFGEYLDSPELVEEVRLRSRGGCLVSEVPKNLPAGFEVIQKDARKYIKAVFEGSPSIGPYKVYGPALRLANDNRLKLAPGNLEIYEIKSQTAMTTTYLFPIEY